MAPSTPATSSQIEVLLEFMRENKEMARGLLRGADGRIRSKRLGESLCNSLNSMGTCTKSVEQWQRVWADKKHLAKKAAGAARRSACATGGGPSEASALSRVDLMILSIMGEGFGEPQTEARVPAFPIDPPVRQVSDVSATLTSYDAPNDVSSNPISMEQPSTATDTLELPVRSQRTSRTRARPHAQRHLAASSARTRIVEVEEQRLQVEIQRNEVLGEIKTAIFELCILLRKHIERNSQSSHFLWHLSLWSFTSMVLIVEKNVCFVIVYFIIMC